MGDNIELVVLDGLEDYFAHPIRFDPFLQNLREGVILGSLERAAVLEGTVAAGLVPPRFYGRRAENGDPDPEGLQVVPQAFREGNDRELGRGIEAVRGAIRT